MSDFTAARDLYHAEDGGTINIGIPPKELAKLATAVASLSQLSSGQQQEISRLTNRLDASEGIVHRVLATLAEHLGAIPPEALPAKVAELVAERQSLLARQAGRTPDPDAAFAELDRAVPEAISAGDDARTEALLRERRDLRLAAAARRAEAAARLREAELRDLSAAAEDEAALGELAFARLRYREAAAHFRNAADLLPPDEDCFEPRLAYRERAASALSRQGEEFGENAALVEAIAVYRALLQELPREKAPRVWALIQTSLGIALQTLGKRESDRARLEEAVAAYRAALAGLPRERVPMDWARAQNNLGVALATLGRRESGTALLEEAVAAYRAALEEWTRERAPLEWATALTNLANVLRDVSERGEGTESLEEAVVAYSAALEEQTRERAPLGWARTQVSLGIALAQLAERETGTAQLKEGLAEYWRLQLQKMGGKRSPVAWALDQKARVTEVEAIWARSRVTVFLENAVAAYRAALEEYTRERVPLEWARTQTNLGSAFLIRGKSEGETALLEQAIEAFRAALEERTRERLPLDWALTQMNLANALAAIAGRTGQPRDAALAAIDEALVVLRASGAAAYVAPAEAIRAEIAGP